MLRILMIGAGMLFNASALAAEPTGTLTLACEGTVTHQPEGKSEPISMGIIVNYEERTVGGSASLVRSR
jgi:hypothetical protein